MRGAVKRELTHMLAAFVSDCPCRTKISCERARGRRRVMMMMMSGSRQETSWRKRVAELLCNEQRGLLYPFGLCLELVARLLRETCAKEASPTTIAAREGKSRR